MGAKRKHVGDEQIKKGYVRIKVAEPNVWKQKQVYIYEQAHNCQVDKYKQCVIFLDGNNRNFNIENLYLLDKCYMAMFNNLRNKTDSPEVVLQKIELVKTKLSMFDLADKLEMVCYCNKSGRTYRRLKSVANERQKLYRANMSPEHKKELDKRHRVSELERLKKMKENEPEKYADYLERKRAYAREYARKRKNEKQNSRCK